jgi:hypothetical protein
LRSLRASRVSPPKRRGSATSGVSRSRSTRFVAAPAGILDPAIVDVFVANCPAILAEASFGDPRECILEVEPEPVIEWQQAELPRLGEAFGDLADLKTPFTHGHSREVARLAMAAAERLRLDAATTSRLQLAALLHDHRNARVASVSRDAQRTPASGDNQHLQNGARFAAEATTSGL